MDSNFTSTFTTRHDPLFGIVSTLNQLFHDFLNSFPIHILDVFFTPSLILNYILNYK